MQPGNMDAHQMRMLFSQLDNPMMMPMQMPFFIPTTASPGSGKLSEKEREKPKISPDPSMLPAFPAVPGMSPFPYGMFPYTPGIPPVQMPLMLPLGASPFMPYNLFPYPGMPIPKDGDVKSGTSLLKELSNNSKRLSEKNATSGKKTVTDSRHSPYDRESEMKSRHSPTPKSDGKKFSDIVQSAIMEGFRDSEKDRAKEKDRKVYKTDNVLDFTTKHRCSPVKEYSKKHKERARNDQYLHLLQKPSLHTKHVKEREKPNTAKLKIEALIDFGEKKPTLSNLKLDLEKGMEYMSGSAFSAASDRYKFSPDTTYSGDERKTSRDDHQQRRSADMFADMAKHSRIKSDTAPRRMSKGDKLFPGEIPRQMFRDRVTVPELDLNDQDVLRGEAHQVRLARYNAERLRMNSFYKADHYSYVEQVEPDSTGDLSEESGESRKKKVLKESESTLIKSKGLSPGPLADDTSKRPRVESPVTKLDHTSTLQDLRIDSSETSNKDASSPPLRDSTVRDKILSYIKSRSKQKQDYSQMPPLVPELPIHNLKLQPGLSIVDSWKHQLAPSLETTAQATLEDFVLDHWRQSLSNEFTHNSKNSSKLSGSVPEAAAGSFATMPTLIPIKDLNESDLEPGEICRQLQSPMSTHGMSFQTDPPKLNLDIPHTSTSLSEPRASPGLQMKIDESINDSPPFLERMKSVERQVKRKSESPFSITDIIGVDVTHSDGQSETSEHAEKNSYEAASKSNSGVQNDQTLATEELEVLPCDVHKESESSRERTLASPKSDRSDSSQNAKKLHRKTDDANTVSAAFALEAVKALDCFSAGSPSACSAVNSNPQETAHEDPYHMDPSDDVVSRPGPSLSVTSGHMGKLKKVRKTKNKLKLGNKKHSNKNIKPDQNLSVLACTDISNVKMTGELGFTGIFTKGDRKRGRPPKNGKPIRKRGRPPKINKPLGLDVPVKKRGPGRPCKVKSLPKPETCDVSNMFVPPDHFVCKDSEESRGTLSDQSCGPPQRKKRSPLFYGCNYNDNFLMGALRIKLPKSEKKLKRKRQVPEANQTPVETGFQNNDVNNCAAVLNPEEGNDNLQPDLENTASTALGKTKECSVLLKDVSPLLADEKNVNIKENPWNVSVAVESEKENKDECLIDGAGNRSQSPARVYSRPQVARRSSPWKSRQAAGNRLVLVKDPSKNGYFVKYSDALREETEKLSPNEVPGDVRETLVNSILIENDRSQFDSLNQLNDSCEDILGPVFDTELSESVMRPSAVDRFKASLLDEVSGKKRKAISQRSRSTDDLTSIRRQKMKKANNIEFDLYKNGMPASPSKREERVSALKEKLKLQQAKIAEIQWRRVESGAQSE